MTAPQPAEKALALYNELIHKPAEDQTSIRQLEWQLRALRKSRPTDAKIAVAFLQALLTTANPSEAFPIADWVWSIRHTLGDEVNYTFMTQLSALGYFERSDELIAQLKDAGTASREAVWIVAFQNAVGLGDLLRMSDLTENFKATEQITGFLSWLKKSGLEKHFARHQKITNDQVWGRISGRNVSIVFVDGAPQLSTYLYSGEDRQSRHALEEKIDLRLEQYYSQHGIDWTTSSEGMITVVLPHIARPRSEIFS